MTSPTRIRVLTPEHLDAAAAALVNTTGTALATAVASKAGTSQGTATGVTSATANTLVGRDAAARTQFADPLAGADAATKNYVDTTIAGYVPNTAKGVASGIATLDGSGFLTAGQTPQYLHQHRGSGTTLPTGAARAGDTYFHTGLNCLMGYDGTNWRQRERAEVSGYANVTAISTNYAAAIYSGFEVLDTATNLVWCWNGTVWDTRGLILGKAWGTAGIVAGIASGTMTVPFTTSRTTGGITYATGRLTLPVDGLWELTWSGYVSATATGAAVFNVVRVRSGVANGTVTGFQMHKANSGSDEDYTASTVVPLAAGDALFEQMGVANASAAINPVVNNETVGCFVIARYLGPLNGATPL